MTDNEKKYADIIDLPHHVSKKRQQMSMAVRAAQFSPFAALTGHDAAIQETARLTDAQITFDEDSLADLNLKIQILLENEDRDPDVSITYFEPDPLKSGGAYITVSGTIKKIDIENRTIILREGHAVSIDLIANIESDIFPSLD